MGTVNLNKIVKNIQISNISIETHLIGQPRLLNYRSNLIGSLPVEENYSPLESVIYLGVMAEKKSCAT